MAAVLRKDIIKDNGKSGLKKKTLDLITLLRLEKTILEDEMKKHRGLRRGNTMQFNESEVEHETNRLQGIIKDRAKGIDVPPLRGGVSGPRQIVSSNNLVSSNGMM